MKSTTPHRIILAAFILIITVALCSSVAWAREGFQEHIVETETGVYYIVQPGDTLWDLSQQFSDSAYLWPDLWKENQQINNPHLIYPGDRIKLYRRKDIQKIQQVDAVVKPPGAKVRYGDIDTVGFIRREALVPSGILIDPVGPKALIGQYDQIYVTGLDHEFQVGDKYTIYRKLRPVRDNETDNYIGIEHRLLGICEITQVADETAIAYVTRSWRIIERQDLLTPYLERSPIVEIKESVPGLYGKFIHNEDHFRITGQFQTAFIDKGESDGVEVGQYYTLYLQNLNRVWTTGGVNKFIEMPKQDIGQVLVLHTEDTTSTVLLTRSETNIEPWTRLTTPF